MRMSWKQRYGLSGEEWAAKELQARGYEVKVIRDWTDQYDLIINGVLPVEVKISRVYLRQVRPGYYKPTFCFDVSRTPKDSDFLLFLICEAGDGKLYPFLVPSWQIQNRSTLYITSHPNSYKGLWAASLENWGNIPWLINIRQRLSQPLLLGTGDSAQNITEWGQKSGSALVFPSLSPFPTGATL